MSKVVLFAKMVAAEGKTDEMATFVQGLVDAIAEEDGCEQYTACASTSEPGVYHFYEVYADAAAFEAHGKGARMQAALANFAEVVAGRPEITVCTPFAAKSA